MIAGMNLKINLIIINHLPFKLIHLKTCTCKGDSKAQNTNLRRNRILKVIVRLTKTPVLHLKNLIIALRDSLHRMCSSKEDKMNLWKR